jgi:glucose uptake protein GlcU
MNQGIFFAILTVLLFGSWAVPTKTLKIPPKVQAFWLTVGHFLLSVFIFAFVIQSASINQLVGPFLAGALWALGITSGYIGIKHLGITRALGLWIPIVIITSAAWGLLFFGEAKTLGAEKVLQTIFSIFLLIMAALAVIWSSKGENKLGSVKTGIIASVTLGLIHGSFFIPLRTSDLPIFVTFLPLTLGMIITTSFIVWVRKLKIDYDLFSTSRMILAGLILGGGNYTALLTIQHLGVTQGYPLTQLGIIVNTLWGAFLFREVTTRRAKVLIATSITIAIIGAILLNSARI